MTAPAIIQRTKFRDELSTCLFRLAPDVKPQSPPNSGALNALAFLLFASRFDLDVRTGNAKITIASTE